MNKNTSGHRVFGGTNTGALIAIVVGLIVLVMFLVCAGVVSLLFWSAPAMRSGPMPILQGQPMPSPVESTAVNPIDQQLISTPRGEPRDGIAVALVIDTTGSMADSVRDADKVNRPKLDIARRCAADLVKQAQQAAAAQPERHINLAIYEFSNRDDGGPSCRQMVPLSTPDAGQAQQVLGSLRAAGGTPIGDAMMTVKRDLDASGFARQHILVITDGENNQGYAPGDVASAISRLPEDRRAAIYLVAFDVSAQKFAAVKEAGGLVLPAAGGSELQQSLDYLLTGKILAEQPAVPGKP